MTTARKEKTCQERTGRELQNANSCSSDEEIVILVVFSKFSVVLCCYFMH